MQRRDMGGAFEARFMLGVLAWWGHARVGGSGGGGYARVADSGVPGGGYGGVEFCWRGEDGADWNLLGDPLSRSTSVYSSNFEIDRLVKSGHAWSRG